MLLLLLIIIVALLALFFHFFYKLRNNIKEQVLIRFALAYLDGKLSYKFTMRFEKTIALTKELFKDFDDYVSSISVEKISKEANKKLSLLLKKIKPLFEKELFDLDKRELSEFLTVLGYSD